MKRIDLLVCTLLSTAIAMVSAPDAQAASATVAKNFQNGLCLVPASTASGAFLQQGSCTADASQLWQVEYVDKLGFNTPGTAYFRLRNKQSDLCADLETASANNGIKLVQRACSLSTTQQWAAPTQGVFVYATNTTYPVGESAKPYQGFSNRFSGKCIDAPPDTTPVQQWTCGSNNNQRWFIAD